MFKTSKLIKLLEFTGNKVEFRGGNGRRREFFWNNGKHKIHWYGSLNLDDDEAHCLHISRIEDEWRSDTDSFPGFFPKTYKHIKQVMDDVAIRSF